MYVAWASLYVNLFNKNVWTCMVLMHQVRCGCGVCPALDRVVSTVDACKNFSLWDLVGHLVELNIERNVRL